MRDVDGAREGWNIEVGSDTVPWSGQVKASVWGIGQAGEKVGSSNLVLCLLREQRQVPQFYPPTVSDGARRWGEFPQE